MSSMFPMRSDTPFSVMTMGTDSPYSFLSQLTILKGHHRWHSHWICRVWVLREQRKSMGLDLKTWWMSFMLVSLRMVKGVTSSQLEPLLYHAGSSFHAMPLSLQNGGSIQLFNMNSAGQCVCRLLQWTLKMLSKENREIVQFQIHIYGPNVMLNHPVIVGEADLEGQWEDQIRGVDVESEKVPRSGNLRSLFLGKFGKPGLFQALFLTLGVDLRCDYHFLKFSFSVESNSKYCELRGFNS